jgi:neutral ceramidase
MAEKVAKIGEAASPRMRRRRRRGKHVARSTAPPRLQAGVAKRPITPPVGGPLLGIPERDLAGGSRGVHDELYARALVLDNGSVCVALVTLDLFAVPCELSEEIAHRVSRKTGIPQDNVVLAASHTYSGPSVTKTLAGSDPDGDWLAVLIAEVTNAVRAAYASKRPARAGVSAVPCPITLKRRLRAPEIGTQVSGGNAPAESAIPEPIESDLGILRLTALDGKTIAILVNFACQPFSVGREGGFLFSADFPGVFAARVESAFPDCIALFTNGAAADVVHRLRSNDGGEASAGYRNAMLLGELLAEETIRVAGTIRARQRLSLGVAKKRIAVPLDVKKAPSVGRKPAKRAFEAVSKSEKQLLAGDQPPDGLLDEAATQYIAESRWMPAMEDSLRRGKSPRQVETVVCAVSIGTLGMVSAPGELYSRSGSEVKRRSPFKHTFVLGYAGDYLGFLAPRDVFEQGGWEVDEAHKFLPGPGLPLVAGTVEDTLTDHMVGLLKMLASRGSRTRAGASRQRRSNT